MSAARVRAFSNGSEWMDWQDRNCCQCKRYVYLPLSEKVECDCPIYSALSLAACMDGTITGDVAAQYGGASGVCAQRTRGWPKL
jgi:hypothetical protein